jgi:hypothetical protein
MTRNMMMKIEQKDKISFTVDEHATTNKVINLQLHVLYIFNQKKDSV